MTDKPKLSVAVTGAAGVWGRYYLKTFVEHERCEVVAIADRSERREEFARHYGVAKVFDSVDEILNHQVPDIVANILPVEAAASAVIACAEAGVRTVGCEKPIAVELSTADQMVEACKSRGIPFGCGTAYWEIPHFAEIIAWLRTGHIGELVSASIPGGLLLEASGAGCVILTMLRAVTGMEIDWVEGLTEFARDAKHNEDCGCYGWLGLSGGIVCTVVRPIPGVWPRAKILLEYTNGRIWLGSDPVFIKGNGPAALPIKPSFMHEPLPEDNFLQPVERLIEGVDTGEEVVCSGHDYRQALEVACAIRISAREGGGRVQLPLKDRSVKVLPALWRRKGGDVAGWSHIQMSRPPEPV